MVQSLVTPSFPVRSHRPSTRCRIPPPSRLDRCSRSHGGRFLDYRNVASIEGEVRRVGEDDGSVARDRACPAVPLVCCSALSVAASYIDGII